MTTFKDFVESHRSEVYNILCKYVPNGQPGASHIMRDYIDRKGKYRRPGLLLLTSQLYGANIEDAMLPAAAQQISEDWILMQDDVEDDSELRRGKPAAQRVYGWVHAFNATNIGHMAMWRMLKDYTLRVGPEKGNRVYEKFWDMLNYTVEGQHIENEFIHYTKDLSRANEAMYYRIADSKTCYYTVYGPMQLGALTGNASETDLQILKSIGQPAGVAFQIVDDILDMTADEKEFGKKNNGDLFEGKITLSVLHMYNNANPAEKERIDAIYKKKRDQKTEAEILYLRELIDKYKSIDYARGKAEEFGSKAKESVEKFLEVMPDNQYKDIVLSSVEEMYIRKK